MGVVLDSTIFIRAERAGLSINELVERLDTAFPDEHLTISVITASELLHGIWRTESAARQAAREEFVEELLVRFTVREVTLRAARIAARIDADLRSRGIQVAKPDLWIASTALECGYQLATANLRDFDKIPGLELVPYQ